MVTKGQIWYNNLKLIPDVTLISFSNCYDGWSGDSCDCNFGQTCPTGPNGKTCSGHGRHSLQLLLREYSIWWWNWKIWVCRDMLFMMWAQLQHGDMEVEYWINFGRFSPLVFLIILKLFHSSLFRWMQWMRHLVGHSLFHYIPHKSWLFILHCSKLIICIIYIL
mgnify:CR=1 FL=1